MLYKFIPIKERPGWFLSDLSRIFKSVLNPHKLKNAISELKERPKYERWYRNAYQRYLLAPDKKSPKQISAELKHLRSFWGVFPYQYFMYDMYLKGNKLTLDQMKDYVPEHVVYFWYYPKINGKNHMNFSNKKYLAIKFVEHNIPAPEVYFFYEGGRYFDTSRKEITADEAYSLLPESVEVLNKPYHGAGGRGITFITKEQTTPGSLAALLADNSLVQQKVVNSTEIRAIHPTSLNTYRVVTSRLGSQPEVIFAFLRVGRGFSKVDNVHQGGLFIGIDIEKGELMPVGFDNQLNKHTFHPDTKVQFEGFKVPAWSQVKEMVLAASAHFDQLSIIGWDVALTPDGPLAIEINSLPDVSFMHTCYGGIRKQYMINPVQL